MITARVIASRALLDAVFVAAARAGLEVVWQGAGTDVLALASADPFAALDDACDPLGRICHPIGRDATLPAAIRIDFERPFDQRFADRIGDAPRGAAVLAAESGAHPQMLVRRRATRAPVFLLASLFAGRVASGQWMLNQTT